MDSIKHLVAHLMLDIDDYLNYLEDYGKSNVKYFNFVLNRQGILSIFLHKSKLLKPSTISPFIDKTFIALKKKFLKESSPIKRSGIIFLFCKIYFTDDIAIKLKLRVTGEEWDVFKMFLTEIEDKEQFMDIRLMVFHLFTENFFRFTVKSQRLALDYGLSDNVSKETTIDLAKSRAFWSEIQEEILKMEYTDIVELKQLAQIRDEVQKPFDHLLPEKVSINEALEGFEAMKDCVNKISFESPKKSRREIIETCRNYISQQNQNPSTGDSVLVIDDGPESDTDVSKKSRKKKEKRKSDKKARKKKENPLEDSEDDLNVKCRKPQKSMLCAFENSGAELKKSYE